MTPTTKKQTSKTKSSTKKTASPGSPGKVPKNEPIELSPDTSESPVLKRERPRLIQFTTNSRRKYGRVIQKARIQKGLSLSQVEEMTGVSASSINAIENSSRTGVYLDVFMILYRILEPQKEDGTPYSLEELIFVVLEENPYLDELDNPEVWGEPIHLNRLQSALTNYQSATQFTAKQIAEKSSIPVYRIQAMLDGVMPKSITAEEAIKLASILPNPYKVGGTWIAEEFIEFICGCRLKSFNANADCRDRLEKLI